MKKETILDPQWEAEERQREAEREARRRPKRHARQHFAEAEGIQVVSDTIAPWDEPAPTDDAKFPRQAKNPRYDAPYVEEDEANEVWLDLPAASDAPIRPENDSLTKKSVKEKSSISSETEEDHEEEEMPERRPSKWTELLRWLLSGNILSRGEVRWLFLAAFLMLLYISNVFYMQQLHRRHAVLTKEVKELRAKSLTILSLRMTSTRQSEIIRELRRRGSDLEELLEPPKVIK